MAAQQPPYDAAPEAQPPYYRVRFEASTTPGQLDLPVQYTVWIPPGVEQLRGVVVHQHGCGEGSCKSGLTGAFDLHWQALAARHDCALLAASYEQPQDADCQRWCDPRKGSDAAFQRGLAELAERSGHAELASVPWALWGHSGGGYWSGILTLEHPDRVAAAWLRSGVPLVTPRPDRPSSQVVTIPGEPLPVPVMLNLGTKEGVTDTSTKFAGVWPGVQAFAAALRATGSPVSIAIDPLTGHECGNQRYLAIPWLNEMLTRRLPSEPGQPLRPIDVAAGELVPIAALATVPPHVTPVAAADFSGDPATMAWLPGGELTPLWQQYVADTNVADPTPPPAPRRVTLQDGTLRWEAAADLESGVRQFIVRRDGQRIALVPEKPKNPRGRPLFQGLQYSDTPEQPLATMTYRDPEWTAGSSAVYDVRALNTAGLKSPPTKATPPTQ